MDAAADSHGENLKLHEYDPVTQLDPAYTVLLFGPRGSGKTVMMKYLLKCVANKLDLAVAFIPTSDTRKEFEEHIPKCFVYPEFDLEAFQRILKSQHEIAELVDSASAKAKMEGTGQTPTRLRRIGIIMDDCMFDKRATKSTEMRWLFMNGRHEHFFHMNAVQYVMDISMDIRTNIDLVVVFPTSSPKIVERLRENLLTCFEKDEDLVDVFQNGLKKHEALVFDRRAFERKEPFLFYCKAEYPLPNFRVGNDYFWQMYYKHLVRRSNAATDMRILNTLKIARDKPDEITKQKGKPKRSTNVMRVARVAAAPPQRAAALSTKPPFDMSL